MLRDVSNGRPDVRPAPGAIHRKSSRASAGGRYDDLMLSRPDSAEPVLRRLRVLSVVALVTFALVIGIITLWPGPPDASGQSALRAFLVRGYAHGIPTWITFDRIEFTSNVVMFVPVGFFGALVLRRRRWLVVPAAAAASAGIETVQALALPMRDGTLRDVASNTVGALIGYLIAALVVAAVRRRARRRTRPRPASEPEPVGR